ncbi:MAG: hypothetical protein ABI388_13100 [Bacteroidia bacterium]
MKNGILLFFFFSFKLLFSQKVEILNKSGFEHNYAIKHFNYIEDINDTSKLKYIATLQVKDKNHSYTGTVVRWMVKMQETAKKLNADAFCLKEYTEKDSMTSLTINLYFAGDYYSKINSQKMSKNAVYIFGTSIKAKDTADFYLNGAKQFFSSPKTFVINTLLNTDYNLGVNKEKITNLLVRYKSEKKSRYFILPKSKASTANFKAMKNPANKGSAGFAAAAAIGGPIAVGVYLMASSGPNRVIEIPYRYGRFLYDIYK